MNTVNRDSIWFHANSRSLFFENNTEVPGNFKTFSTPAVNISENLTSFVVDLAVPGLKKEYFPREMKKKP